MRILHMIPQHSPTGAAAPALLLARGLAEAGHTVHFACRGRRLAERARALELAGVHVLRLGGVNPVSLARDVRAIGEIVARERIDAVHCHRENDHVAARLALGPRPRRVPIVRTYHEPMGKPANPLQRLLFRYAADAVIAVSRSMGERLSRTLGAAAARVRVVPGAIDARRFTPGSGSEGRKVAGIPPGRAVVGMSSKITPDRGVDRVMRAFSAILNRAAPSGQRRCPDRGRVPDAHLLVVGENLRAWGRELVSRLGLAGRVTLTTGGERFVELLRAMDVGVLLVPGHDGSARAVLELMALEKPVVVADVGSLSELVDGSCGRVVRSDDELPGALYGLLADDPLRRRLGRSARSRVLDRHALPAWVAAHERIYREVVADGSRR